MRWKNGGCLEMVASAHNGQTKRVDNQGGKNVGWSNSGWTKQPWIHYSFPRNLLFTEVELLGHLPPPPPSRYPSRNPAHILLYIYFSTAALIIAFDWCIGSFWPPLKCRWTLPLTNSFHKVLLFMLNDIILNKWQLAQFIFLHHWWITHGTFIQRIGNTSQVDPLLDTL